MGRLPVTVVRGPENRPFPGAHAHDFLLVLLVASGRTRRRVDGRDWVLAEGDVFVVPPGAVVGAAEPGSSDEPGSSAVSDVWAVLFPAESVDPAAAAPLVSWRGHPLLAPFGGDRRGGATRLRVPPAERPAWVVLLGELREELRLRRDGYGDAARALLTLLLVRIGRLGVDAGDQLDPLVVRVFAVVEARFTEELSLRDVAAAVGFSPGHLTTVVRRATGRTVQQWIIERRMREARRLLAETTLTVADVAGRVGYRDPGYFLRRFRAEHGLTPTQWRTGA